MNLTETDLDVLEASTGKKIPGLRWGAAFTVSVELLCKSGLLQAWRGFNERGEHLIDYRITDKGREALKAAGRV
jgi:hypothetical protein